MLSTSAALTVGSNPTANAAVGGVSASHIAHMGNVLQMRSGSQINQYVLTPSLNKFTIIADSIKTSVLDIHPYRAQFTNKCKLTINNMFVDHTAHRYLHASTQKIKIIAPNYLAPIASISTQITTTGLVGWTCFGLVTIGFTTLGALYLF